MHSNILNLYHLGYSCGKRCVRHIRPPKLRPMRPTTAAVKPNLNMSEWKGEPLHSMLFKQEKEDIARGALVYGSLT